MCGLVRNYCTMKFNIYVIERLWLFWIKYWLIDWLIVDCWLLIDWLLIDYWLIDWLWQYCYCSEQVSSATGPRPVPTGDGTMVLRPPLAHVQTLPLWRLWGQQKPLPHGGTVHQWLWRGSGGNHHNNHNNNHYRGATDARSHHRTDDDHYDYHRPRWGIYHGRWGTRT